MRILFACNKQCIYLIDVAQFGHDCVCADFVFKTQDVLADLQQTD